MGKDENQAKPTEKAEIPKPDQKSAVHEEKPGQEIIALKKTLEDYQATMKVLQAEFENFRKRVDKEKDDYRKFAAAKVMAEFLPLYDSLSEAAKQAEKNGDTKLKEGIAKILSQYTQIMQRNGVRELKAEGEKFDPDFHECLMTANEKDMEDDAVLEEFQKGFTLNGIVIRHAKVKVNKKG